MALRYTVKNIVITPQQQALLSASTLAYRFLGEEAKFWYRATRCMMSEKIMDAKMDMFKLQLIATKEDPKDCNTLYFKWVPKMELTRYADACFRCPPKSSEADKEACKNRKEEFRKKIAVLAKAIRDLEMSLLH